ncbi:MAG TPA: peptide deformylase [Bacteroidota bacterium]|nr:peptide deformylase [Bacteroidota bacterium]
MSIRPILLLGNPVLRAKCSRVKSFRTPDLEALVNDLRDTLADFRARHGFGRGISAPQLGDPRRVLLVNVDTPRAIVNPVIVRRSRTMMTLWDDCFSFPDISVKLKRHLSVHVRFQDPEGKSHALEASGPLAELLQHEIDHLDGILAIDRAIDSRHIVYTTEIEKWKLRAARKEM